MAVQNSICCQWCFSLSSLCSSSTNQEKITDDTRIEISNWDPKTPDWSKDTLILLNASNTNNIPRQTLEDLTEKSSNFPLEFPIDTNRCQTLKKYIKDDILERNINSAYPIIHENALKLFCNFILFKRKYGNVIEKALYKDLSLKDFINRLLVKRAVMFVGKLDHYFLLSKREGSHNWDIIGTTEETPPLLLSNCLSYDEIKCSAFLSVSSYTYFVNLGDRKNAGKFTEDRQSIENEGIIIGMIGPRLQKPDVMEYQEIIISEKQNTKQNGYGRSISRSMHKLFSEFYEEECLNYKEVKELKKNLIASEERYTDLQSNRLFDNHYYHKRLSFSIDTLLMEANCRAKIKQTSAYLHVVGFGLGVWKISSHQERVFMNTFAQRISSLGRNLSFVSDICFSYINHESCGDYGNGQIFPIQDHPSSGIKIHIYKREPHQKLVNENEGKLLVVSYAWDGNALPGNEYWFGSLETSGDSAAASSTQITELHNPHINPLVSADNLMVVTKDNVVPLEEYQKLVRYRKSKISMDQLD